MKLTSFFSNLRRCWTRFQDDPVETTLARTYAEMGNAQLSAINPYELTEFARKLWTEEMNRRALSRKK